MISWKFNQQLDYDFFYRIRSDNFSCCWARSDVQVFVWRQLLYVLRTEAFQLLRPKNTTEMRGRKAEIKKIDLKEFL